MAYSKKKPAKKAGKKKPPPFMKKMTPADMKAMKKKGK